jgi:hypothetical protein
MEGIRYCHIYRMSHKTKFSNILQMSFCQICWKYYAFLSQAYDTFRQWNFSSQFLKIPSRVSKTKTRDWIGESVYWIFTSRTYNQFLHSHDYCNYSTCNVSSNSSSGHTAVPLELRNSSEVNSHSRTLSYLLGTDHAQKTHIHCCMVQTTLKTSYVIANSPVHWRADCCLVTSYKH